MAANQFTGCIPVSIGNLTRLTDMQVSEYIQFVISCIYSIYRYLNNNELSGVIPNEIGNLTNLETLLVI